MDEIFKGAKVCCPACIQHVCQKSKFQKHSGDILTKTSLLGCNSQFPHVSPWKEELTPALENASPPAPEPTGIFAETQFENILV